MYPISIIPPGSNSPGDRGLRGCLCTSCEALQTQLEVEVDPDRVADMSWPCAPCCPWHRCLPLRLPCCWLYVTRSTNTKTNNAKNINKSDHNRNFRPTNYNSSNYRAHLDIKENNNNSNNCNDYNFINRSDSNLSSFNFCIQANTNTLLR